MSKPKYDVVMCNKGWQKLYQPIIDNVIHYDELAYLPEDKIGIKSIDCVDGVMEVKLINPHNASEELKKEITCAENLSSRTCEYCGETKNVGTTMNFFYKTCCKACWERHILPHYLQSIWKDYTTNIHHKKEK